MSEYIEVGSVDGLEPGSVRTFHVENHEVLVARVGDEYYITDARCPHLGGPLAKGVLEGTVITCPWHHSQFDVTTGACVRWTDWSGPVLTMAELVKHPRPVRAYESKVEDGTLFIGEQK
ncbi:MAG: Rieske (2Fe-2S) protein, partial [Actinobacteria bacterium]